MKPGDTEWRVAEQQYFDRESGVHDVEASCGNVFADIGCEDAERKLAEADIALDEMIMNEG